MRQPIDFIKVDGDITMIKCDYLIKLGYEFKSGDEIYSVDNLGGVFVTLGKRINAHRFKDKENDNHEIKLDNSGWSLIKFTNK